MTDFGFVFYVGLPSLKEPSNFQFHLWQQPTSAKRPLLALPGKVLEEPLVQLCGNWSYQRWIAPSVAVHCILLRWNRKCGGFFGRIFQGGSYKQWERRSNQVMVCIIAVIGFWERGAILRYLMGILKPSDSKILYEELSSFFWYVSNGLGSPTSTTGWWVKIPFRELTYAKEKSSTQKCLSREGICYHSPEGVWPPFVPNHL